MRNFSIKILLVVYFTIVSAFYSQSHIKFSHLTVEDGLSQSAVTCILQDQKGFMWFGTQDGLNRFDGYDFKIFRNIAGDSTSLTDNFIFSIYEDTIGTLYFETQSGNFHKYNPLTESFKVVAKNSIDLLNAKFNSVGAKFIEPNGIMWTGGLSKETGLTREELISGNKIQFNNNPSDQYSISNDKVYSILKDRAGNVWVGTFDGLNKLNENTGKFTHFKNEINNSNSIPGNWVWPVFEDSKGYLWIGTVKAGLSRYDPRTNTFINYKNDPTDQESLSDNFIFSIYEDRTGVIWIGTNAGGINFFHPSSQIFEHYVSEQGNKNSLSTNAVQSLYADKNGNYWIGTLNEGLDRYNPKSKTFKNFSNNPNNSNSLIGTSVQSIFEDNSGLMWIGTFSNGLDSYDLIENKFMHYRNNPADPNTLSDNRIYAITQDSKGIIWIGTYGGGLNKFDKRTGKFSSYKHDENDSASISSNAAWSVIEDNLGMIWVGTFGGGINILNKENEKFTRIVNNPNDSTSLPDNNIIRIYQDSRNNIWVGTTKGLSKYIKGTNNFKNYTDADGLANNFVYGILEDGRGYLWISTNNGLSRFDTQKETFKNYYLHDGLQSNEFNQNAFAKDFKTGRLLFGGPNGFNVFHPDSINENNYIPPIVFTDYIRFNSDDDEGKPIYEKGISEIDSIYLTFKDNIITFKFSALDYHNNSMNQYRYKLEGFNENWIQLGNNRTVTFTNLSPGDYVLRVIGSNNDGVWNEEGASLFIEVSPPWWGTKLAYLIYIITFFSGLFGIRRVEKNMHAQKAQIREHELLIIAGESEKRALRIENERKTKELEEARKLQLSMLPRTIPQFDFVEIAAFMRTATEVGGDYYDIVVQSKEEINIAFGDATGHGLQAGTMVTLMKGFFTSDSTKFGMLEFMSHCNKVIKEINLGRILMSLSILKIEPKKFSVSSGGMPPVYHYSKSKGDVEEILLKGMPLGAMSKFPYSICEQNVDIGDVVLLITDGMPEQINDKDELYDYPRIREKLIEFADLSPDEIIKRIMDSFDEWNGGSVQADDISLMVIKFK